MKLWIKKTKTTQRITKGFVAVWGEMPCKPFLMHYWFLREHMNAKGQLHESWPQMFQAKGIKGEGLRAGVLTEFFFRVSKDNMIKEESGDSDTLGLAAGLQVEHWGWY